MTMYDHWFSGPWSSKNLINQNWLKKFMQVCADVTCMHTNFGGCGLFGFRVMAPFNFDQNLRNRRGHTHQTWFTCMPCQLLLALYFELILFIIIIIGINLTTCCWFNIFNQFSPPSFLICSIWRLVPAEREGKLGLSLKSSSISQLSTLRIAALYRM